jgi:hypothetical protein
VKVLDEPERRETKAGTHAHTVGEQVVDVCELEKRLVGVLELDLGVEEDAVAELVPEITRIQDRACASIASRLVAGSSSCRWPA